MFKVPEKFRIQDGPLESDKSYGNNGAFRIPHNGLIIATISSDEIGWEHVSVSIKKKNGTQINRCPTWEEMCLVKDLFWDDEDVVIQYHPKKSEYINNHKYCLHLWRPNNKNFETPSKYMVGI
jgi:hypothetical protein